MDAIGERLRTIRSAYALSQQKFCGIIGCHEKDYNRYETDVRLPRADFLQKVCLVYNINPTWLLYGKGNPLKAHDSSLIINENGEGAKNEKYT